MHILKSGKFLLTSLIIAAVTAFAIAPARTQEKTSSGRQKIADNYKQTDDMPGPVVDYESEYNPSTLTDSKEHVLRQIKGARYSRRAPEPLGEFASVEFAIHTDWEIGLQPLPVAQSDVVILGKVIDARAYLSDDKMGVYSEFKIRIDKTFKNSGPAIKDFLIAEREGGVVRFSSGRILPYRIFRQRLPRIERSYVFFLRKNEQGEDYHIITGYEIRSGRISPLDEPERFAVFKGLDKPEFLSLLQETITNASSQQGRRNQ